MRAAQACIVGWLATSCQIEEPYGARTGSATAPPAEVGPADRAPAPAQEKPAAAPAIDDPEVAEARVDPAAAVGAKPQGEPPAARTVEPKADGVTLLDAGAQPRQALRLQPTVGHKQRVELQMKMKIGMTLAAEAVPPTPMPVVKVVLDTEVTRASDKGISYAFTVAKAERSDAEGSSKRVLSAVDQAVANMQATKGTIEVTPRGERRKTELTAEKLPTPGLRPSLTGFQQSFGQLYPALPAEPVGVGATWTAVAHFELGGAQVQQEATYTLKRRDGDKVELMVTFTQAAVGTVAAPKKIGVRDTKYGGRGNGSVTLDLRRVAPLRGTTSSRGLTVATLDFGGGTQQVTMDMALELGIAGSG